MSSDDFVSLMSSEIQQARKRSRTVVKEEDGASDASKSIGEFAESLPSDVSDETALTKENSDGEVESKSTTDDGNSKECSDAKESNSKEQEEQTTAMEIGTIVPEELRTRKGTDETCKRIHQFLRALILEQQRTLEDSHHSTTVSASEQARMLSIHRQSRNDIKILFRILVSLDGRDARDALTPGVLLRVAEICAFCQKRQYVKANDAYMKLAIGNAPWPLGITGVGIHERAAHHKISTGQVKHILNDDQSRRWIQAVKRMITFCQTAYPPTDRSQLMG